LSLLAKVVVCPVGWRNVHQLDVALRAVFGAGCARCKWR